MPAGFGEDKGGIIVKYALPLAIRKQIVVLTLG